MAEITQFSSLAGAVLVEAAHKLRLSPVEAYAKLAKLAPVFAHTAPEQRENALSFVTEAQVVAAMSAGKCPCEHQKLGQLIIHQMWQNLQPIEVWLETPPPLTPYAALNTRSMALPA